MPTLFWIPTEIAPMPQGVERADLSGLFSDLDDLFPALHATDAAALVIYLFVNVRIAEDHPPGKVQPEEAASCIESAVQFALASFPQRLRTAGFIPSIYFHSLQDFQDAAAATQLDVPGYRELGAPAWIVRRGSSPVMLLSPDAAVAAVWRRMQAWLAEVFGPALDHGRERLGLVGVVSPEDVDAARVEFNATRLGAVFAVWNSFVRSGTFFSVAAFERAMKRAIGSVLRREPSADEVETAMTRDVASGEHDDERRGARLFVGSNQVGLLLDERQTRDLAAKRLGVPKVQTADGRQFRDRRVHLSAEMSKQLRDPGESVEARAVSRDRQRRLRELRDSLDDAGRVALDRELALHGAGGPTSRRELAELTGVSAKRIEKAAPRVRAKLAEAFPDFARRE